MDRLDYIKGIPHRLRAFDRFLQTYPEWVGKVVLIQIAVPSRTGTLLSIYLSISIYLRYYYGLITYCCISLAYDINGMEIY